MNKSALMNAVIENLERDLQSIIDASTMARKAATEAEAKAEHKYDTRGLEQSYLADGQARRGIELKESIALLKSVPLISFDDSSEVQVSALVEVEDEEGKLQYFFILPVRGGIKIQYNQKEILTLSPDSPMGENILLKTVGESIEVKLRSQTVSYRIRSIR